MPARYGAGRTGTDREAAADPAGPGEANVPATAAGTPQDAEAAELAARLRTAIQHLMPLLRAQHVHSDLTPSRLAALAELADGGPLRISELAARMGIALSTASRMVDLLDGLGWIERQPDPADLRATLISLADAGGTVLRSVRTEHTGVLAAEIAQLPPGRIRQLHDALPALEALAERAPRRSGAPRQHPR